MSTSIHRPRLQSPPRHSTEILDKAYVKALELKDRLTTLSELFSESDEQNPFAPVGGTLNEYVETLEEAWDRLRQLQGLIDGTANFSERQVLAKLDEFERDMNRLSQMSSHQARRQPSLKSAPPLREGPWERVVGEDETGVPNNPEHHRVLIGVDWFETEYMRIKPLPFITSETYAIRDVEWAAQQGRKVVVGLRSGSSHKVHHKEEKKPSQFQDEGNHRVEEVWFRSVEDAKQFSAALSRRGVRRTTTEP